MRQLRRLTTLWLVTVLAAFAGSPTAWALPAGATRDGRPGATADERQLGALAADQLIRQHGLYQDAAMQARIERVAKTLTVHVPGGVDGYRFRILKSDDVNAMTTPDGQVLVTRALMLTFTDDADLAAVLAHEISHVMLGHTARLLTEPDEVREVVVRKRSGKTAKRTVTVTSDKKRNWEFEADEAGIELLQTAGYSAEAMERILIFLTEEEKQREAREAAAAAQPPVDHGTHPKSEHRLQTLRKLLSSRVSVQREAAPPQARTAVTAQP